MSLLPNVHKYHEEVSVHVDHVFSPYAGLNTKQIRGYLSGFSLSLCDSRSKSGPSKKGYVPQDGILNQSKSVVFFLASLGWLKGKDCTFLQKTCLRPGLEQLLGNTGDIPCTSLYTLWKFKIAIENDHFYSWFIYEKWGFSIAMWFYRASKWYWFVSYA